MTLSAQGGVHCESLSYSQPPFNFWFRRLTYVKVSYVAIDGHTYLTQILLKRLPEIGGTTPVEAVIEFAKLILRVTEAREHLSQCLLS